MRKFTFSKENFILYLLSKIEPVKSDKIRLNKIAFFVEFAYFFKKQQELSNAKYAAIDMGPVIDGYAALLSQLEEQGKIKVDARHNVHLLETPELDVPEEVRDFIDPLIEKYASFTRDELITLSHQTDSYKITTYNEKVKGKIIDKDLAALETFFEDEEFEEAIDESKLPAIDKETLVRYEL